jgi:hypothetical protein
MHAIDLGAHNSGRLNTTPPSGHVCSCPQAELISGVVAARQAAVGTGVPSYTRGPTYRRVRQQWHSIVGLLDPHNFLAQVPQARSTPPVGRSTPPVGRSTPPVGARDATQPYISLQCSCSSYRLSVSSSSSSLSINCFVSEEQPGVEMAPSPISSHRSATLESCGSLQGESLALELPDKSQVLEDAGALQLEHADSHASSRPLSGWRFASIVFA